MDVIAKAKAERAVHVAEIAKLDTFIEMYERLNGDTPVIAHGGVAEGADAQEADAKPTIRRRVRGGTNAETLVRAMRTLLLATGRPMTRTELVDGLESAGYLVGGTDKSKNLGTIIWRSQAFDNRGDGYWPRGEDAPMPPGYDDKDLYQAN